jgi:hypothetical protein
MQRWRLFVTVPAIATLSILGATAAGASPAHTQTNPAQLTSPSPLAVTPTLTRSTGAPVQVPGAPEPIPATGAPAQTPTPSPSPAGPSPATSDTTYTLVCDEDGPCLNDNAVGHAVSIYDFDPTDPYDANLLYYYDGDYGCGDYVTPTCPFDDVTVDEAYLGDNLVEIGNYALGDSQFAYPDFGNVDWDPASTAPDRATYVEVPTGNGWVALVPPYWVNQYDEIECLYGPPAGDDATVNECDGSTRQNWDYRS